MSDEAHWDVETDVLVVGSGAGALTAAVVAAKHRANVLVVEKSEYYGGTSATSGGAIWIPANYLPKAVDLEDSPEEAFQYLRALADSEVPDINIRTFVEQGREMVDWLQKNSEVRFAATVYTDYHPDVPGAKLGNRTLDPLPLPGKALLDDFQWLRPPSPVVQFLNRISWTTRESVPLLFRPKGWMKIFASLLLGYYLDIPQRLKSRRDRRLTLGNALIGRLKLTLDKNGGRLWRKAPLLDLVVEAGQAVGAVVSRDGNFMRIRARKGIVLAAGGFERNPEMRAKYLPAASANADWSGSQPNNTGDAIWAARRIGAATVRLDSAWWAPSLKIPGEDRARMLIFERAFPGCIIVDQSGRRYMNEASSYHIAAREMMTKNNADGLTIPSWILFDARYRSKYPMGPILPKLPDCMIAANVGSVLVKGRSWTELARKANIPEQALIATIAEYNENCRQGRDPLFHRGENAYDRYYGDPRVQPNPNLSSLDTAPFYAMPIYPGDIGTNGGLVTNENAQVLDNDGQAIGGLYAVGNMAASIMGHAYPAAGTTLGPAMCFGYLAARHIVGANG